MTQDLQIQPMPSGSAGQHSALAVPGVIVIDVRRGPLKNFTYLVSDPRTSLAVLIDPAWEFEKIQGELARTGVTLAAVLVTHAHPDHTDLASTFAEQYSCPILASAAAIAQLPSPSNHARPVDNSRISIGQLHVDAILTPGHTAGCVCFLIGANLFSGDTLFAEGCGMCSGVAEAHAMFSSLETLKRRLTRTTRIFPGHSYGVPPGQPFSTLLHENIYLQFNSREAFTAFRLRSGQNLARMFQFS